MGGFTFLLPQAHHGFVDDERGQTGLIGHRAPLDFTVQGTETFGPAAEAAGDGAALHPCLQGLEGLEPKDAIGGPGGRLEAANRGGKSRASSSGPLAPAAGQEEPEAAKSVLRTTPVVEMPPIISG